MSSLLPKKIIPFIRMGAGALEMASIELAGLDENETGNDDKAAMALHYCSQLAMALANGQNIPLPPAELFKKETIISSPATSKAPANPAKEMELID